MCYIASYGIVCRPAFYQITRHRDRRQESKCFGQRANTPSAGSAPSEFVEKCNQLFYLFFVPKSVPEFNVLIFVLLTILCWSLMKHSVGIFVQVNVGPTNSNARMENVSHKFGLVIRKTIAPTIQMRLTVVSIFGVLLCMPRMLP